jgi:hypothetical protein
MPDYDIEVTDSGGRWKQYSAEVPLEYGSEITVEAEDGSGDLRVRVVGVDNDAFFTSKATCEPVETD